MKFLNNLKMAKSKTDSEPIPNISLYDIALNDISGSPIELAKCAGKHILLVNVASECGFTKQYADLQKLHETYKDQLVVIGAPCNQFGGQEPGNESEIQTFCERNFGVSFLLTEKLSVKGSTKHPLYEWLTEKDKNGQMSSSVQWNFQKYLVDENGKLIDVFYSITKPTSSKITTYLKSY